MKRKFRYFLPILLLVYTNVSIGQTDTAARTHTIAIFVPLYLDSVFDATEYRFDKNFPKFLNQGLEFYEGAQLALDSLQTEGAHLDVHIYDTRSSHNSITQILKDEAFQQVELIIGHVTNGDLRQLADAALHKNIPFI